MAAKQSRSKKVKHTRRRASKAWRGAAPAVIPVTARFALRFAIAERHRRDEAGEGGN